MSDQQKGTVWDERFSREAYVYGTEANDFLQDVAPRLPPAPARVLSLAEGEGRNAVFLAGLGHRVTGVDSSAVGLQKAEKLAAERGVEVETILSDLAHYRIEPGAWDAIVSIFCHLPPNLRVSVHRQVVEGLRPGGILVLEGYTPKQLQFRTGGPPTEELMYTLDMLREDFAGLDFLIGREVERDIHEGLFHNGHSAVVQILAKKP